MENEKIKSPEEIIQEMGVLKAKLKSDGSKISEVTRDRDKALRAEMQEKTGEVIHVEAEIPTTIAQTPSVKETKPKTTKPKKSVTNKTVREAKTLGKIGQDEKFHPGDVVEFDNAGKAKKVPSETETPEATPDGEETEEKKTSPTATDPAPEPAKSAEAPETPEPKPSEPTQQIETDPIKLLEDSNKARKEYYASKKDFSKLGKSITQADKETLEKKKNAWDKSKQTYITELLGNSPDANRPKVVAFLEEEAEFELEQKGGLGRVVSKNIEKWDKWGIDHLDKNGELVKGNWKTRLLKTGITTTLLGLTTYFGLTKLGIGEQSRLGEATSYLSRRLEMALGFGGLSTLIAESGIKNKNVKLVLQILMMGSGAGIAFATGGLGTAAIAGGATLAGIGLSKIARRVAKSEDELTKEMLEIKKESKLEELEENIKNFHKRARNQRIWRKVAEATGTLVGISGTTMAYGALHHDHDVAHASQASTEKHEHANDNQDHKGENMLDKIKSRISNIFEKSEGKGEAKPAETTEKGEGKETPKPEVKTDTELSKKEIMHERGVTLERTERPALEEKVSVEVKPDAIVHKAGADGMGGGITYAFKEQLLADTKLAEELKTQMKYGGEINTPEFYKAAGEHFGYIKDHEIRIDENAQEKTAYQFDKDTDGKIIVNEIKMTDNSHGEIQEIHHANEKLETKLENYEHNDGKVHHYENGHEVYESTDNGDPRDVTGKYPPGPQSAPPLPGEAEDTTVIPLSTFQNYLDTHVNVAHMNAGEFYALGLAHQLPNGDIAAFEALQKEYLEAFKHGKVSMDDMRKLNVTDMYDKAHHANETYVPENKEEKIVKGEKNEVTTKISEAMHERKEFFEERIDKIFGNQQNKWHEIQDDKAMKYMRMDEAKITDPETLKFVHLLHILRDETDLKPETHVFKPDEDNTDYMWRALSKAQEIGKLDDIENKMENFNHQELSPVGGTVVPQENTHGEAVGGSVKVPKVEVKEENQVPIVKRNQ